MLIHVQTWRMRKQWIPGPFLSPREKGLGTRLGGSMPTSVKDTLQLNFDVNGPLIMRLLLVSL